MHCPFIDFAKMQVDSGVSADDVDSRGALAIARVNWIHGHYPTIVRAPRTMRLYFACLLLTYMLRLMMTIYIL